MTANAIAAPPVLAFQNLTIDFESGMSFGKFR